VITRTSNFGTNHLYLAAHSLFSANPGNFRAVIYADQRARIIYTLIATALAAADPPGDRLTARHKRPYRLAPRLYSNSKTAGPLGCGFGAAQCARNPKMPRMKGIWHTDKVL
jgi:hypothetical protein